MPHIFNECIDKADFLVELKLLNILPVYKNGSHRKKIYRLISILPFRSKILECCLYDHIFENVDNILPRKPWATGRVTVLSIHQCQCLKNGGETFKKARNVVFHLKTYP